MSPVSRRDLLRGAAAAVGASLLLPSTAKSAIADGNISDPPRIDRVGLQLYTVRNSLAKDLEGTIAAVAAAGVTEVEFANYFNKSAEQWKVILSKFGLTSPSTHIGMPATNELWKPHFEMARSIGHQWVIVPWVGNEFRGSVDAYKRLADRLNESGYLAQASGLRFGYHNHDFEFQKIGDTTGFEVMMTALDSSLVDIELDLYWAVKSGQDPLAMMTRWPGRFQMCHVKDAGPAPERKMTEVGAGVINFAAILGQSKTSGFKHWFIEHDEPAHDIASVIRSAMYMTKLTVGGA